MSTPSDFQILETVFESPEFDHQSMSPASNILNLEDGLNSSDFATTPETDKDSKSQSPKAAPAVMFIEPPTKRSRVDSTEVPPPQVPVVAKSSIAMAPKFPERQVSDTANPFNASVLPATATAPSVPIAPSLPEVPQSSSSENPTQVATEPGSSKQDEVIEETKSNKGNF